MGTTIGNTVVIMTGKASKKSAKKTEAVSVEGPSEPKSHNGIYIEVKDLVKKYGDVTAVDGISLKIKKGEVFAFLGPNGAGKTTTVEMIETIRTPTSGTIKLMGMDVSKRIQEIKNIIGVLPQEFSSLDLLKVRETLEFFAELYDKRGDLDKLMADVGVKDHANKLYKTLSGGLKRRVGIAVALVNDPEIIFLDEPTTGLDPLGRREVWTVISDLKKAGKTIFLTTHYMEEAEELADQVAVIHKGKIIAEGTVDELITKYGHGLMATFSGVGKDFEATVKGLGYKTELCKEGNVIVTVQNKDELVKALADIDKAGADFKEINVRRANLEEVFLQLTGEALKEGAEP
jgi:ABC-2 type transport system ATP-binding protein